MSYVSAKGYFWGVTKSVKSRYIGSYTEVDPENWTVG